MSTLETVEDYISDARTLLQDTIAPYRYDDPSLLVAFNVTILEAYRLRPDLFRFHKERGQWGHSPPNFAYVDSEEVKIEPAFRLAFVYGTVAHALARDQEDVQDNRANSFMNLFSNILIGVRSAPIQGGATPAGAQG